MPIIKKYNKILTLKNNFPYLNKKKSMNKIKNHKKTTKIHTFKDIPAQWAKIRQGLDIFRISSKCVCLSNGEV